MDTVMRGTATDHTTSIFERRRSSLAEELPRLFDRPEKVSRAVEVLATIAGRGAPITRRDVYQELGMTQAALAGLTEVLEDDGYVVWSRRFSISLGPRFLDDPALSRVFSDTMLRLSADYLDALAHRFDGSASLAFRTREGCIVAATSGPLTRNEVQRRSACVLSQTIRGASPREPMPALTLRGISAGYAGENMIVVASRVRLRRSSYASMGLTTRTLTLSEFSEVSQHVGLMADLLTSSLRRTFPLARPDDPSSDAEWAVS